MGDIEKPAASSHYGTTLESINAMNEAKDMDALKAAGGVGGLAKQLGGSAERGLTNDAVQASLHTFGPNRYKEQPAKNFFVLCYEAAHDPIILLLMFAATISTVLGAAIPDERAHNGWVEGVAIWIAVLVVIGVGAGNDFQKDQQFRKLNAQREAIQVKVVRNGEQVLVNNTDVVVGDVLILDTGDKVCADGIVILGHGLVVDEASLTGEGDPIHKNPEEDPWVRSGTQVTDGSGRILISAVGPNSEWGKIMTMVGEEGDQQTPLQVKLEWVAAAVGKVGFGVAVACFIVLLIKWCVENKGFPIKKINDNGPVQFFLYAITIIVVAVPEGLPLAVTISLAYSMKKMMKDNNFVRVLAACETMGGATAICSDKTGTLTENRMTVTQGWFCGARTGEVPTPEQLPPAVLQALKVNITMTSKAFLIEEEGGQIGFVGNRTECALLMLLRSWGIDYRKVHEEENPALFRLFGFSSERKMSCCVMSDAPNRKYVVHNKGAAEWVLQRCVSQYTPDGSIVPLSEAQRQDLLDNHVVAMAQQGLRCIALTTAELPMDDASRPADFFEDADNVDGCLTLLTIVGIKDPVRKEVPLAVQTCQEAGITVRMVTGDNIHTARHIARDCGILPEGSGYTSIEGPAFRKMSPEELKAMLPNMRVLARSSPEDKKTLVKALREMGEVVAVTGDGTNDAAALKASDVGLAMGIAGTEVAKEAADIVIMDDNFSSIVKSVLWGRSVFTNIRKFLQFQLTVNLVALVTAFIGAVVGGDQPLNVLQLLWVNMIMDSMGALALATENPRPELLLLRPHGRDEPLITTRMWKHICTQGIYQIFWMMICLYALRDMFSRYSRDTPDPDRNDENHERALSLLFNAFVCMQVANEVNARRINDEYDIFSGLFSSRIFMGVLIITMGLQAIIINFLGSFFKTVPLDWKEWLVSLAIGAGAWPASWLVRWFSRTFRVHRRSDERTGVANMYAHIYGEQQAHKTAKAAAKADGLPVANGTRDAAAAPAAPAPFAAAVADPATMSAATAAAVKAAHGGAAATAGGTSSSPTVVVHSPSNGH